MRWALVGVGLLAGCASIRGAMSSKDEQVHNCLVLGGGYRSREFAACLMERYAWNATDASTEGLVRVALEGAAAADRDSADAKRRVVGDSMVAAHQRQNQLVDAHDLAQRLEDGTLKKADLRKAVDSTWAANSYGAPFEPEKDRAGRRDFTRLVDSLERARVKLAH